MAKIILVKCPSCGTYNEVKQRFLSHNVIRCKCGSRINIMEETMQAKECDYCGNTVFVNTTDYTAKCPICGKPINKKEDLISSIDIHCPECNAAFTVNKNATVATCPMCNVKFELQEYLKKQQSRKETGAMLIKYDGGNNVFVWKHPIENFNFGSQLVVGESQEAILFKDGKAWASFDAGRYTLDIKTLPDLEQAFAIDERSDVAVRTEIYFINKVTQMNLKWGTDTKIRLLDPESNIYMELGAFGTFNMKVTDGKKLLVKLVGTEKTFGVDSVMGVNGFSSEYVAGQFKTLVMNKVKSNLSRIIINSKISVITIDQYLDLISDKLRVEINDVLGDYGLFMPEFYITNVLFPEEDPNFKRLKQQYAERTLRVREEEIKAAEAKAKGERMTIEHEIQAKLNVVDAKRDADTTIIRANAEAEALKITADAMTTAYKNQARAEADEMKAKDYTYQDETTRIIGQEALNGNTSGIIADTIGLGVTLGAVNAAANIAESIVNPISSTNTWRCSSCGKTGITSKFCPDCGKAKPETPSTWTCKKCGKTGITSRFCPDCGKERS